MSDMHIVDRRPNPKDKSLTNRQRFLARARGEMKGVLEEALKKRTLGEGGGEKVSIPGKGISEPLFHHNRRTGRSHPVYPGNKDYVRGDKIPRPTGGAGQGGREGSPDGSGEDDFEFMLSREEFLDMFFEDLELPDLVKKSLRETSFSWQRAGYTMTGSPSSLSVPRTMRQSMARRISLHRPKPAELEELERELAEARERGDEDEVRRLTLELEAKQRRNSIIPYIDPIDVRYRRFERVPKPNSEAVMFCVMDVSGSMTEAMKDLAKRFFLLLHIFLTRRYRHVEVVFIRHTSDAKEVDEETFFYGRETGGTVVSSALDLMVEIQRNGSNATGVQHGPYPLDRWNIYGAQASDGDNYSADSAKCASVLGGEVLPLCQYYAYIEVGDGMGGSVSVTRNSDLWRAYDTVAPSHAHLAMRKVGSAADIFPVFHELFEKKGVSHG